MAYYIGIDLGTTNSAIVTFDGEKHVYGKQWDRLMLPLPVFTLIKKEENIMGIKLISN